MLNHLTCLRILNRMPFPPFPHAINLDAASLLTLFTLARGSQSDGHSLPWNQERESVFESYGEAKARHMAWRHEAYATAREEALLTQGVRPSLRLEDIDARALDTWATTWKGAHPSGAGRWNWPALVERLPKRAAVLPMAIWFNGDLCGLALGYASRHRAFGVRHTITLTHVERRPEPPEVPLRGRVIPIAITAAENYGIALGATRLRLSYPDRNLLRLYQRLGFSVAWKGDKPVYCEREI